MTNSCTIAWQRVMGNITEEIDADREKYKTSNDTQLVIHGISLEDQGIYQAVIARRNLKRTSNTIFLKPTGGNVAYIFYSVIQI
jgi:hypothetical protein